MYTQFWSMNARPFAHNHEPTMFVPVQSAMLALTKLRYAISANLGACALFGAAGVGKTELARIILNDFTVSGWATVYVANPAGSRDEIFGMILHQLDGRLGDALSPLEALASRIEEISLAGGKILVVFDDLQSLRDITVLDDLRMLMNIEPEGILPLNILLCGQSAMDAKLTMAGKFNSRLSMRVKLLPFVVEETEAYILQRLKNVGCTRGVFTKHAAEIVAQASGGVAGNINRLCELSLVMAYALNLATIKPEIVKAAARDLELPENNYEQRIYDEVWSGDIDGAEKYHQPEVDILAAM